MQDKKWIWILGLALLSIGANFWAFPVYILDEAKNAACAMEMFQRGDWITPTFNDQLRTDKPPLHYFFMMASYAAFGVSAFSARLFSVLFGLATVAVVYRFVYLTEGARIAFYSGLVMISSLYLTVQFHLAVPDPYFIFFLTLSWLSFAYGFSRTKAGYFYLSYAAMSLAFMAKGPLAVVLCVLVFTVFLITHGRFTWKTLMEVRVFPGILIFILIAAPWWIAVWRATDGEWPAAFIFGHNIGRYMAPFEGHGSFPGAIVVFFFVALLPLAGLVSRAIRVGWSERLGHPVILVSIIGVGAVLIFFIFSRTLLPTYVGPAVPVGAILVGYGMDQWLRRKNGTSGVPAWFAVLIFIMMVAAPFGLRSAIDQDPWIHSLPELAWLVVPLPIGAGMALYFFIRKRNEAALISYLGGFWLVAVLFFFAGAPRMMALNPVTVSLPVIQDSGRETVGYYFFNSAYVFALKRPLRTFYTPESLREYSAGKKIMVVTRKNYEAELTAAGFRVVFEQPYLFEGSVSLVMVNEE